MNARLGGRLRLLEKFCGDLFVNVLFATNFADGGRDHFEDQRRARALERDSNMARRSLAGFADWAFHQFLRFLKPVFHRNGSGS